MLRLNQNIPLGFFMDLKWESRGPVKAKSLLRREAGRSGFGGRPALPSAGTTDPAAPGEAASSAGSSRGPLPPPQGSGAARPAHL